MEGFSFCANGSLQPQYLRSRPTESLRCKVAYGAAYKVESKAECGADSIIAIVPIAYPAHQLCTTARAGEPRRRVGASLESGIANLTDLRDCCGAAPLTSHGTVAAPAGELAW